MVTGRFLLTQILTQNRKFRYGQGSTNGKTQPEYPYRTAPNGRIRAEKTPRPILLSSRSGVRVPSGVPLLTSGGFSKLNMVDVAQLVSASDCGSEGRGFESHYPPHKKNRYPSGICSFYLGGYGIRRARPTPKGWVKNMPVACFLARGRIHRRPTASGTDVDGNANPPLRYG